MLVPINVDGLFVCIKHFGASLLVSVNSASYEKGMEYEY